MFFLPTRRSAILVACLGLVATSHASQVSLKVEISTKANTSTLQLGLQSSSTIKISELGENKFVIEFSDPSEFKKTAQSLSSNPLVTKFRALEPRMADMDPINLPVGQLRSILDEFKASYDAWRAFSGGKAKADGKYPSVGYLEAYLQYAELRAYPNQNIDFSGYDEIAKRRAALGNFTSINPEGPLGQNSGGREAAKAPFINKGTNSGNNGSAFLGIWQYLGPRNLDVPYTTYYGIRPTSGRTNALAYDPTNSNIRYLGGAQGGVWKTIDAGVNWTPLGDAWPTMSVSSLAVLPSNNIVLAGTGDFHGGNKPGIGVFRSADGGTTWSQTGTAMGNAAVGDLDVYPDDGNVIFACTGRFSTPGDVWKSTDAGLTWTALSTPATSWSNLSIGAASGGTRIIWAVGYGTGNVYKSTDVGATWQQVTVPQLSGSQGAMSIAASKVSPDTAYLMSSSNQKILKTTNGGSTWTDITTGFPTGGGYNWTQSWYDYHIETSSVVRSNVTYDIIFTSLIDIVMSDDSGATWKSIGGTGFSPTYSNTATTHNDQHCFAINPNDPLEFMAGNDGGVYSGTYSNLGNVTWTGLSKNLGITQFYTFSMFPTIADYVMGGTQDNASPHSFGNLSSWDNVTGGDGAGTVMNYNDVFRQYGSSQYHGLQKTSNAWQSAQGFKPNFNGHNVPFIGGMWIDPNDPKFIYVNTDYINQYNAVTGTWKFMSNASGVPLTNGRFNVITVAKGDSDRIYGGTTNGQIWMTTDGGTVWARIDDQGQTNGLPNKGITSINVSDADKNDILVGLSGGGADHLYRCQDVQAGTRTYTNLSGTGGTSLPAVSLNDIARDTASPETTWYVATDVGVFKTANAGSTWSDVTQPFGLPNVQVSKLYTNSTNNALYAATFGRGMWRIGLGQTLIRSLVAAPSTIFENDETSIIVNFVQPVTSAMTLTVSSDNPAMTVPATLSVAPGQSQVIFKALSNEVNADTTANITVTEPGGATKSIAVSILNGKLVYPTSTALTNAINVAGTVKNLKESDDFYYSWKRFDTSVATAKARLSGSLAGLDPDRLQIDIEMKSSYPGLSYTVYMFDQVRQQLVGVGGGSIYDSDTKLIVNVIGDPSKYIGANGRFDMVIEVGGLANAGQFIISMDRVVFKFH